MTKSGISWLKGLLSNSPLVEHYLDEIQVEFVADKILRPAQHCRFGLRRTLIVAGGEKWPNVVERRRERRKGEKRRG